MIQKMKGLWKLLFGRTTIIILLILIQLAILFGGVAVIGSRILICNTLVGIVAIIIMFYVMNSRQNTAFKQMWIIIVLSAPLIGVTLYVFTRLQPGTASLRDRFKEEIKKQQEYLAAAPSTLEKITEETGKEQGVFRYMYEDGFYPPYSECGIKYFPLGENKFDEMKIQLEKAEKFIFMEYFIIAQGEMWDEILDILIRKATSGVEVRLMYDGTNSMLTLPKGYRKEVEKHGIKCLVFDPIKPFLSTHQNNRDHRKILVVDGKVAFTGGVNIADEYINRKKRFGHWKDTAVMVKGGIVDSFTVMFLGAWNVHSNKSENYVKYMHKAITESRDTDVSYGGYMTAFGDSPLDQEAVGKKVYMNILNTATEYVHIMTPYLIIDEEFVNALTFASQRGIDVKLILPHVPDKKYAYYLARTYYRELIDYGVKLYEYTPGFVHAKVFASDDIKAVVGTINLDFRSLYLHFEDAVYIWNNPVVDEIENDFKYTLSKCQEITAEDCDNFPKLKKICGSVLRLIAPLM